MRLSALSNTHMHLPFLRRYYQVLDFSEVVFVRPGQGLVLLKYFQGRDQKLLEQKAASIFEEVRNLKPKASRKESSETYLLARKRKVPGR